MSNLNLNNPAVAWIGGIVIGCVLTIFGSIIIQDNNKKWDTQKRNQETAVTLSFAINERLSLAENVIHSNGSSLFSNRWDEYINKGYQPFHGKISVYKDFIKQQYPQSSDDFDTLTNEFENLHRLLVEIRKLQGATLPARKDLLKQKIKDVGNSYGRAKHFVNKIDNELHKFN